VKYYDKKPRFYERLITAVARVIYIREVPSSNPIKGKHSWVTIFTVFSVRDSSSGLVNQSTSVALNHAIALNGSASPNSPHTVHSVLTQRLQVCRYVVSMETKRENNHRKLR
jgi:hypothetical protein